MRACGAPPRMTGLPFSVTRNPVRDHVGVRAPAAKGPVARETISAIDTFAETVGWHLPGGHVIEVRIQRARGLFVELRGEVAAVRSNLHAPGDRGIRGTEHFVDLALFARRHLGSAPGLRHRHAKYASRFQLLDEIDGQPAERRDLVAARLDLGRERADGGDDVGGG